MSDYREGCQLSAAEITAVLSLAGKKTVVGLPETEIIALTSEKLWNACCALMRDEMLSQTDGKFCPSKALMAVMQPMCQARCVLALTPASDMYAQTIFYVGDTVSTMTRASYGRYILRPIEAKEMAEQLMEQLELSFSEISGDGEEMPLVKVGVDEAQSELLKGAHFVVEQFHPDSGQRVGWLRLVEPGLTGWLQWTEKGGIQCEELSHESLDRLIRALLRGEL